MAKPARVGIGRAVGPIRPRSFRVQANYLDELNASRVRIHRQKPKALGLKFGCGFTWHLSIKVLRLRDIDLWEVVLLSHKLRRDPLI